MIGSILHPVPLPVAPLPTISYLSTSDLSYALLMAPSQAPKAIEYTGGEVQVFLFKLSTKFAVYKPKPK